jgi:hypothetical protein
MTPGLRDIPVPASTLQANEIRFTGSTVSKEPFWLARITRNRFLQATTLELTPFSELTLLKVLWPIISETLFSGLLNESG